MKSIKVEVGHAANVFSFAAQRYHTETSDQIWKKQILRKGDVSQKKDFGLFQTRHERGLEIRGQGRARLDRPVTLVFVTHLNKTPFGINAAQDNIRKGRRFRKAGLARRSHSDIRLRCASGVGRLVLDGTVNNGVATYGQGRGV